MKNRDWVVIFSVFFAWMLVQPGVRALGIDGLPGLLVGLAGLLVMAGVVWLVLRRRKARAAQAEVVSEEPDAL